MNSQVIREICPDLIIISFNFTSKVPSSLGSSEQVWLLSGTTAVAIVNCTYRHHHLIILYIAPCKVNFISVVLPEMRHPVNKVIITQPPIYPHTQLAQSDIRDPQLH